MHVAVTGASSGLGEAVARELARAGAEVTLIARRRDALEKVARELGVRTHVATCDLADEARATEWIAGAEEALGPIDVLVSNAGFMTLGPVASFDPDEGARMIAVNFATPVRLARAIVPKMIARGQGVFVNVTSVAAFVTLPGWAYQAASKAASATFSEALHDEIAGTGVHVLTAYPGPTDTPMTRAGLAAYGESGLVARLPLGRPEAFARRLRLAIASRNRRLVYPRFYGLARLFPRISRWVSWRVAPRLNPAA